MMNKMHAQNLRIARPSWVVGAGTGCRAFHSSQGVGTVAPLNAATVTTSPTASPVSATIPQEKGAQVKASSNPQSRDDGRGSRAQWAAIPTHPVQHYTAQVRMLRGEYLRQAALDKAQSAQAKQAAAQSKSEEWKALQAQAAQFRLQREAEQRADDASLLRAAPTRSTHSSAAGRKSGGSKLWKKVVADRQAQGLRTWKRQKGSEAMERKAALNQLFHSTAPSFITFRNLDAKIEELSASAAKGETDAPAPLRSRLEHAIADANTPAPTS